MLKKLLSGLNQRKVKVFSLFLLCSSLAWLISNLSENYESRAYFNLNYRNLPDSLLLGTHSEEQIEAKLRASGFQFLYYNFFKQRMDIDVSQVAYQNGRYVLDDTPLKRQMEQQLSQNVSLIELDRRQLAVDLYQVDTKRIPIEAKVDLQLEQNYILDGTIQITPDSILVKGPKTEIDTIRTIKTTPIQLTNVNTDFSREMPLVFPKGLDNSIFSFSEVTVTGKISKFSEKIFEVPIKGIHFPEGYDVKIFPDAVTVLCKATIDRLKEISATDFEIIADYAQLNGSANSTLFLEISQKPENVYDVRLEENTVNFVLEQQ